MKQIPVIFACSHHRGGNSDHAAALFLEGIRSAGGDAELVRIGDMDFRHCTGCLKCRKAEGNRCIFANDDGAQELYEKIMHAPFTFFSSPIYFYHLPSRLKTFIDRGQWAFEAAQASSGPVATLPVRPAYACLLAGRPKGAKLFEGAELTLKFFLRFFRAELQPAITFRGIDLPGDLQKSPADCSVLLEAGSEAWKRNLTHGS
ncbi:flavodoxin family protein [Maridesulfovibrio sp.]|uniref:flavodoxin family protein n=1 Tax=Maridesulfovibrio sp. TaxID=2795000 RepID=UPI002A18B4BC|nr:flavodoxin family protein [Maridesulfovibrio sp.]